MLSQFLLVDRIELETLYVNPQVLCDTDLHI